MWRSHNSCIDAIHAVRQFIKKRADIIHPPFPGYEKNREERIEKREEKRCRQSRRIKINRADDIRPYGQYIAFSYSIVGGGASTPRKDICCRGRQPYEFSTFNCQLSIVNCQLKTVRPKELSLRAAKAAWQSVTPAAP